MKAGLPTGHSPSTKQEVLEGQGEDERDDPGEDDPERAAHRDPAEQTAHEAGDEGRQEDAEDDGQPGPVGEDRAP